MTLIRATDQQIKAFTLQFEHWSIQNHKLHRVFLFADFVQAFGFMTEVALMAERMNHHPEWFNVYKQVVVDLTTHEVSGISVRDFELAQAMESIVQRQRGGIE